MYLTYTWTKRGKTKGKNLRIGKKSIQDHITSSEDLLCAVYILFILTHVNIPQGECQYPGKSIAKHNEWLKGEERLRNGIPALLLTSYRHSVQLCHLLDLQFPHLYDADNMTYLMNIMAHITTCM